jgi:hypothetical protein
MINGLAEQNLLLIMTERLVDNGDDIVERHKANQRECAEHAAQLVKLLDMHVRIGAMLADEQRRFASYLPPQQKPAQAHARLAVNRDNADGTK